MKIQEVIKASREAEDTFARPVSWRGTGTAVDLFKRLRNDRVSKIAAIHESAANASEWNITPEDLLDSWELVSIKVLAKESKSC